MAKSGLSANTCLLLPPAQPKSGRGFGGVFVVANHSGMGWDGRVKSNGIHQPLPPTPWATNEKGRILALIMPKVGAVTAARQQRGHEKELRTAPSTEGSGPALPGLSEAPDAAPLGSPVLSLTSGASGSRGPAWAALQDPRRRPPPRPPAPGRCDGARR